MTFGGFRRLRSVDSGDDVRQILAMGYLGENRWEQKKKVYLVDMFILFIRSDAFMYIVFAIFR